MSSFASQPPSRKAPPVGSFFRGGMMPAAPMKTSALILFDLRSLNLTLDEGKKIEQTLRDVLYTEIRKLGKVEGRSAVDIGGAVFGVAID